MKMKNVLVGLMLALTMLATLGEAMARPMGGGRSFGRQSPNVSRQAPAAPRQATPAAAPTPAGAPALPPKPATPWKGIIGGALLGLGMGALLSHFGFGGALGGMLGSLLMIALLALVGLFIYRLLRGKAAGAPLQNAGNGPDFPARAPPPPFQPAFQPTIVPAIQPAPNTLLDKPASTPWGVPADFDRANFLRGAKASFIRLQAAWDKSDVNDIREFTTPEVYAEIKLQIQERGAVADFTDVVTLEAELLGIDATSGEQLVSVQFDAMIRAAPDAAPAPFSEVWNMLKSPAGAWILSGIQQHS